MSFLEEVEFEWRIASVVFAVLLQVVTSGHALLHKRDSRSAMMWTAFIWFSPVVGALAYAVLGINRIQRRAVQLRKDHQPMTVTGEGDAARVEEEQMGAFADLVQLVTRVVGRPLVQGNDCRILVNGDEAYPQMLQAIREARVSLTLSTYIFDYDPAGLRFMEALTAAQRRGVAVRVLIDDVGSHYSPKSVARRLRAEGIRCDHFLPRSPIRRLLSLNLRNHRKILVVDGQVGFTGGMNFRHGNCLQEQPPHPIQDVHFRLEGPVVAQLQEVFADDWLFCTGERLEGEAWFPSLPQVGELAARVIPDGPDEDFEKLPLTIYGAVGCAQRSVMLTTPYFLPERELITVLNVAALRGVELDLILPARNNLPFMHWASRANWNQFLERGCRIWLSPPPFDHSKMMVVDEQWSLIGSANLDPRSLRLNFELNVEVYGAGLAGALTALMRRKMKAGRRVTLEEWQGRSLPVKLLDGLARIFTPYL